MTREWQFLEHRLVDLDARASGGDKLAVLLAERIRAFLDARAAQEIGKPAGIDGEGHHERFERIMAAQPVEPLPQPVQVSKSLGGRIATVIGVLAVTGLACAAAVGAWALVAGVCAAMGARALV